MTGKEYLRQYKRLEAQIVALDKLIADARAEQRRLSDVSIRSAWPDGQPHGTGTTDPVGETATRNADRINRELERLKEYLQQLEEQAIHKRHEMWSKRNEITEAIGKVKDATLNRLLTMRYIDGETFEVIAVELHYTWRHTLRLHGEALRQIEKLKPWESCH